MEVQTGIAKRFVLKAAGVVLVVALAAAVFIPSVFAKTGKFQVLSWRPPVTVKGKKAQAPGILVVEQTIKEKGKTKIVKRVFYVPEKVAKRFAKIGQGFIVKLTFNERIVMPKGYTLKPGDVSKMTIVSGGSGDASGSEGGGAGESESTGGGGGGGT